MTQRSAFVLRVGRTRSTSTSRRTAASGRRCWTALAPPGSGTTRSSATAPRCSATSSRTTSTQPRPCGQEVCARWQDAMADLLEERVPDAGPPALEEIFRLD